MADNAHASGQMRAIIVGNPQVILQPVVDSATMQALLECIGKRGVFLIFVLDIELSMNDGLEVF